MNQTATLEHGFFQLWAASFFSRIISSAHCALYCGRIVSVDGTFKTFLLVCKMTFSSNLFWQFSRANAPHTLNLLGIQSYVVWTRGTQIKSTGPSSCCLLQSENPTWCCKAAGFTSNTALHIMTVWRSVKCSVEHGRLPVLTDGLTAETIMQMCQRAISIPHYLLCTHSCLSTEALMAYGNLNTRTHANILLAKSHTYQLIFLLCDTLLLFDWPMLWSILARASSSTSSRNTTSPLRVFMPRTSPKGTCWHLKPEHPFTPFTRSKSNTL